MSEGSIILRTTIAGILGLIIVRNSIDEQVPSCILAMPPKAVAMASCPAHQMLPHDHREKAITPEPPTEEMPFLLRNVAANYVNSEYVPRRREFIQPDQSNNLIVLNLPSCPDKDQAPPHVEPEVDEPVLPVNVTITPNTGALVVNDEAVNILMNPSDDGDDMELAYNSAPCPDKDQSLLHIEPEGPATYSATGGIRVATTQSQFVENPAPIFIPAARSNLVTVLTQYPEAPKTA